jgi:hypothetical protein
VREGRHVESALGSGPFLVQFWGYLQLRPGSKKTLARILRCLSNLRTTLGLHDIGFMDDDPNSVAITISKEQALYVYRLLEPNAVVRVTFTALLNEMRRKGWI